MENNQFDAQKEAQNVEQGAKEGKNLTEEFNKLTPAQLDQVMTQYDKDQRNDSSLPQALHNKDYIEFKGQGAAKDMDIAYNRNDHGILGMDKEGKFTEKVEGESVEQAAKHGKLVWHTGPDGKLTPENPNPKGGTSSDINVAWAQGRYAWCQSNAGVDQGHQPENGDTVNGKIWPNK